MPVSRVKLEVVIVYSSICKIVSHAAIVIANTLATANALINCWSIFGQLSSVALLCPIAYFLHRIYGWDTTLPLLVYSYVILHPWKENATIKQLRRYFCALLAV